MGEQAAEAIPRSEVLGVLADKLQVAPEQARDLLFETYHPERLWVQIGAIGLCSIAGMLVYDLVLRRIDAQKAR